MKYQFIKKYRSQFSVKEMCHVLQTSRSGYYRWLKNPKSNRTIENEKLLNEIIEEYEASNGIYGSPKITVELKKKGIKCSRPRVARLMRKNNIRSKTVKKFVRTTDSNHTNRIASNLVDQNFYAHSPNCLWLSDITYIKTSNGWLYLAVVMDVYSRKIIGWSMDTHLRSSLVINALKDALSKRRPSENLVFHSDRGVQYTSDDFLKLLKKHSIIQSMSGKGNCYDNAMMESFFGQLKKELVYLTKYNNQFDARQDIFKYIEVFYNRKRIHSAIDYKSPVQFETITRNEV